MTNKDITKNSLRKVKELIQDVKSMTPDFTTIASTIRLSSALQAAPR